jgi:hypothetical protein
MVAYKSINKTGWDFSKKCVAREERGSGNGK